VNREFCSWKRDWNETRFLMCNRLAVWIRTNCDILDSIGSFFWTKIINENNNSNKMEIKINN